MNIYDQLLIIAIVLLFLGFVVYILVKLILWARKGGKGAILVGALFTIFAPDPIFEKNFKIVQESKKSEEENEDDSGGPPNL